MKAILASLFALLCVAATAVAAPLAEDLATGRAALERRDVVAAMQAFSAALETDPGSAEAAYERGRLLLLIGEPAKAVADFTTAILSRPDFGRAYVGRAEAKLVLKDGQSAIADFDRAIEVSPQDPDVHVARAAFRLKIGNLPGARADLVAARAVADEATAARIDGMLKKLGGQISLRFEGIAPMSVTGGGQADMGALVTVHA